MGFKGEMCCCDEHNYAIVVFSERIDGVTNYCPLCSAEEKLNSIKNIEDEIDVLEDDKDELENEIKDLKAEISTLRMLKNAN